MQQTFQTQSELIQRIRTLFQGLALMGNEIDRYDAEVAFVDMPELNYDSTAALECIIAVEDEFGIVVDYAEDDITYAFRSLANITQFVQRKLEDQQTISTLEK